MEPTAEKNRLHEYQEKLNSQTQAIADVASRWGWMAYLRGGLFLASVAVIFPGLQELWGYRTGWFVLSGILFFAFLAVAFFHEGLQANYRKGKLLVRMYRESIARLNRDWENIKVPDFEVPKHQIALAKDLDLIGPSSLFKLTGIVRTPLGINTLADWILNPSTPEEVVSRQTAVAELAEEVEWRERFQLKCESLASSQSGPSQFVEWCERLSLIHI